MTSGNLLGLFFKKIASPVFLSRSFFAGWSPNAEAEIEDRGIMIRYVIFLFPSPLSEKRSIKSASRQEALAFPSQRRGDTREDYVLPSKELPSRRNWRGVLPGREEGTKNKLPEESWTSRKPKFQKTVATAQGARNWSKESSEFLWGANVLGRT